METPVFLAVLLAALMHGAWNVLIKLTPDRFVSLCLIQLVIAVMGMAMLAIFPWPAAASVPHAIASGFLHLGYNLFLIRSYRTGHLSQVYPIARGSAPLLTFLGVWIATGERMAPAGLVGIAVLVAGLWVIGAGGRNGLRLHGATLFYALGTAAFIAAYSTVDGLGSRVSGSPSGYAGLMFLIDGLLLVSAALIWRGPSMIGQMRPFWAQGLAGGLLSATAYWIVIWAMAHAPIAAVAALRETSILFVLVLSQRVLREALTLSRVAGAILILAGAVLIRLS